MNEGYNDFVFGLQALRRRVERDARGLGGALGAAVRLLPHQVANVARVLTDLEVRHLLADEVGLGKTAQAIMIMNALRLQRPDARIGIVVPDTLMAQWRDELRARGHVAPVEGFTAHWDEGRPVLAWPQLLQSQQLPFDELDVLIVDELQQLTQALQDQIVAAAPHVEAVLLLTATPPLESSTEMRRVLSIIEPVRAVGAIGDAFDALRDRERSAHIALSTGDWTEQLGGAPPPEAAATSAAAAHCAARRVVRTRRAQWARFLPSREPRIYLVEPTEKERERQRLMWAYFRYLGELSREFDLDLLAQRVIRGPASLKQRVTYLKGHGHDRGDILVKVQALLRPDQADSRFDALLDILFRIWDADPESPVLIAAGDNLTVEDLETRLPRLLDVEPDGRPVTVATLRNQTRGADSLSDSSDAIAKAVDAFQSGDARILIAAEVGSVGLNLQRTRHLVLYSIPWDPTDVEQWVGRIDRIGNSAVVVGDDGELKPIEVHVPALRGLVDERVVEVIRATAILERSVSLDRRAVSEARTAILEAALSDEPASWHQAMARAEAVGRTKELEDLGLPLLQSSPWAPSLAAEYGKRVIEGDPIGPIPAAVEQRGEIGRERALESWLSAMGRAGEYHLGKGDGARTISYPQRAIRPRGLAEAVRVPLDETVIPWPRQPLAFYLSRRTDLEQPPVTHRVMNRGDKAPSYFLDHGSPLHEALLDAWLRRLAVDARMWKLVLPTDAPDFQAYRRKALYVRAATADASRLLGSSEATPLHAREADERFLRATLPSALLVTGAAISRSGVEPLPPEVLRGLVAPDKRSPLLAASCEVWSGTLPEGSFDRAAELAERSGREELAALWSPLLPRARAAIDQRVFQVRADLGDRLAAIARERDALRLTEATTGRKQHARLSDLADDESYSRSTAGDREARLLGARDSDLPLAISARASAVFFLA